MLRTVAGYLEALGPVRQFLAFAVLAGSKATSHVLIFTELGMGVNECSSANR